MLGKDFLASPRTDSSLSQSDTMKWTGAVILIELLDTRLILL